MPRIFAALLAPVLTLLLNSPAAAVELDQCNGPLEPSLYGDCAGLDAAGCCDAVGRVLWCQGGDLYCIDCAGTFPSCGWNPSGYYDCGQEVGSVDPSGEHPPACVGGCDPSCAGKDTCSPDCPGDCGTCTGGAYCMDDGTCYTPACSGKECGEDPLGFSCGVCPAGTECVEGLYQCLPLPSACTPQDGPGCDGCGCEACVCELYPFCCEIKWDLFCAGACKDMCGYDCSPCPAEPDCSAVECGEFCGIDCGTCPQGEACFQGQCCVPSCDGKECGSDGCGGDCGECPGTEVCDEGVCVACQPACDGKECGDNGCGGVCGECADGMICAGGLCSAVDSCVGNCGDQAEGGCYCDAICEENGDCCEDFCEACPDICDPQDPCNGITWEGCCDGEVIRYCEEGEIKSKNCGDDPSCGWNEAEAYYDCGTDGAPDPEGIFPMDCGEVCTGSCESKACGDDGCGGDCGACPEGETCTPDGQCCTPDCADKTCGSDGCDGTCGECVEGEVCLDHACVPDPCDGIDYFGCCDGQTLRWCQDGEAFEKDCAKMTGACGWSAAGGEHNCGTDGGEDPSGDHLKLCPGGCAPDCEGLDCGDDGCGGTCGVCGADETCEAGVCVVDVPVVEASPDTVAQDTGAQDTIDAGPLSAKLPNGCAVGTEPAAPGPLLLLVVLLGVVLLVRRLATSGSCVLRAVTVRERGVVLRLSGVRLPASDGRSLTVTVRRPPDRQTTRPQDSETQDAGPHPAPSRSRLVDVAFPLLLLFGCGGGGAQTPSLNLLDPVDTISEDVVTRMDTLPEDTPADRVTDLPADTPTSPDTVPDVPPDVQPEPPVDCDNLPSGPFELVKIEGAIASEDLAFDGKGHLIGSNNQAIYKSTADGQVSLLAPDVEFRSGMRYLPSGLLAVNDNILGRILLVDPDGVVSVLLSGLSYPNGMTVDKQGFIYVTEHDAGRVLRIHSYTGEYTVLTEEIDNPNGITFNNAYDTLYIGSFGASAIYELSISPDGVPGRLEIWADFSDTPGLMDGMGVDICGNVYVCEYGDTDIWRISPDGKQKEKIIIGGPLGTYLPNLQWGRGPGWDPMSIYIPDGWQFGVWRAEIGVPSKPQAFPPGE